MILSNFARGKLRPTAAALIFAIGIVMYLLGDSNQDKGFGKPLENIGTFVAATEAVGFLYEFFMREDHDRQVLDQLDKALERQLGARLEERDQEIYERLALRMEELTAGNVPGASEYGLRRLVRQLDFMRLFEELEEGDELRWLDTYCPDQVRYQEPLIRAVQRGAHIRMLVIHPQSATLAFRAGEIQRIGYEPKSVEAELANAIRMMTRVGSMIDPVEAKGTLEVRTYSDLPCIPMYMRLRDGHLDVGFTSFFLSRPSYNSMHLEWRHVNGGKLRDFNEYFQGKWQSSSGSRVVLVPPESKKPETRSRKQRPRL